LGLYNQVKSDLASFGQGFLSLCHAQLNRVELLLWLTTDDWLHAFRRCLIYS